MIMTNSPLVVLLATAALAAGCASTAETRGSNPNDTEKVGDARRKSMIEDCRQLTEKAGAESTDYRGGSPARRPKGAATGGRPLAAWPTRSAVMASAWARSPARGWRRGRRGASGAFRAGRGEPGCTAHFVSPVHGADQGLDVIGWK